MGEIRQPSYIDKKTGERRTSTIWWVRYYRNGRRHEESSGSDKKTVAIGLLKRREGAIENGEPITSKISRLKFDEAVKDVVTDYRVNGKRTVDDVERRITLHLEPYFGGWRMSQITTADLRAYIDHRQTPTKDEEGGEVPGAGNATINRELAIIKRAFRLARQAGKLLHVPHVPMLHEHNVRTGFFERDQFEAVRDALPEALRGVMTFAYLTGWRIRSEVLPLQWSQVDRNTKTIRLEPGTTKNAEGRTLPYDLLPDLVDVIETQWRAHKRLRSARSTSQPRLCPHVFQRDGEPIKNFRKAWDAACEAAGHPDKIPHDFRRTAVRNLVRAGVPEKTAMSVTGHKTRSVFDRYDIVNEADLRAALGKLSGASETGTIRGRSAQSGRVARFRRTTKSTNP